MDAGVTSLVTQMFFDNACFYRFMELVRAKGITVPIHAGIMPITTAKQLGTTVSLSGSSVPKELADLIATYGENKEDMRKAGIDYAVRQILDLKEHGVDGKTAAVLHSTGRCFFTLYVYGSCTMPEACPALSPGCP